MRLQVRGRSLRSIDEDGPGLHESPAGDLNPPKIRRLFLKPRPNQAEAKILVEAPDLIIKVILKSLKPELESSISDRSNVTIEASEKCVLIKVVAYDITALRAAVNSYLYWIQGIIDIGRRLGS